MRTHLPHVDKTWTVGTVLASVTSILSLVTMIGSCIWFAAKVDDATATVPAIQKEEVLTEQNVAVLQDQQKYTDARYIEIMEKLKEIDIKLDRRERQNDPH